MLLSRQTAGGEFAASGPGDGAASVPEAATASAAVASVPTPSAATASSAAAAAAKPIPELPPFPRVPLLQPLEPLRHVTVSRTPLTYRLQDGREIERWGADLYAPRDGAANPRALIVMLPAGGFRTDLATSWAESFARAGFLALALHRLPEDADEGVGHSLKGTAKTFFQDAVNLRRAVAWAATLPGVDPRRIGVLGVSRGAIATALVAQADPGLSAVLVLGAADLPGLFRDSQFGVIEKMRQREIDRNGGSLDKAMARAEKILGPVDPASRPGHLDPERTLLINARWDHIFPRAQALALRQAAGNARQEWLPCGHQGTLLFAGRVRRLALEHFTRTLGAPALARNVPELGVPSGERP